jgi:hypothetical protein
VFSEGNPGCSGGEGVFRVQVGPSFLEISAAGIRLVGPKIDLN